MLTRLTCSGVRMASDATLALDALQRKPVAAGLRSEATVDRTKLAVNWKRQQGRVFVRVLELARMSLQEAAHAMGYRDATSVSRWVSAVDRVQWDRVAEVEQLKPWISVAWGEATGADVHVTVVVRRRPAAS